jgi:hypothetical protein
MSATFRSPRVLAASLAASIVLLLAPATASALVIKSAVVHDPVKGDSFTVKGEFGALPLDDAAAITLEFDGFQSGFGMNDLKRRKQQLSFKGPAGAPGIAVTDGRPPQRDANTESRAPNLLTKGAEPEHTQPIW